MDMPGLRGEIVRNAVVSMTTIILGFLVAGITGIFTKLDGIADIKKEQSVQAVQVQDVKDKMGKIKDDSTDMKILIAGFAADHKYLIQQVGILEQQLAAARKSR
jgi:cysteine sulfinate desulfinase/cysteine desulfurase-like protein